MEIKFKSQICTTREQGERLLALGLKKETADMYYRFYDENTYEINPTWDTIWEDRSDYKKIVPAWSLHRLLSMLPDDAPNIYWILDGASISIEFEDENCDFFPHKGDIYEGVVNCIEWLIKEGYFNKEYLV